MDLVFQLKEVLQNPVLSTTALMAVFGSFLYTAKDLPKQLLTFCQRKIAMKVMYKVTIFQYDDLYDIFEKWLAKNYVRQYRDVQAYISFMCTYPGTHDVKTPPPVTYRQAPNHFVIKIKGKILIISKSAIELGHAQTFSSLMGYTYTISGFNCRATVEQLLQDIVKEYWAAMQDNAVRIYSGLDYGEWRMNGSMVVKDLDKVIIDPEIRHVLKADLEQFKVSQAWYDNLGIPYKRTFLFHGPPGTGKTSLAKAIAMFTGRNLYSLNISSIKNDNALQQLFSGIPQNSVLVLEDIDAAFKRRENSEHRVTFSCLLNCIDGVFYRHGLITCITTNHLDHLDAALLREGRTDRIIEIGLPAVDQINEYLTAFYAKPISLDFRHENFALPMSGVQEICLCNREDSQRAIQEIKKRLVNGMKTVVVNNNCTT
ncbi:AAA family ATPase [Chitinophaga sp. CC14]|uniref:AAA family ATPase n=1 Tax=Chitinophaga sp. CC14 TaxID=3029199 RepID=UPI003B77E11A